MQSLTTSDWSDCHQKYIKIAMAECRLRYVHVATFVWMHAQQAIMCSRIMEELVPAFFCKANIYICIKCGANIVETAGPNHIKSYKYTITNVLWLSNCNWDSILGRECPLHYSTAMQPLYWAACNLYSACITLCIQYTIYMFIVCFFRIDVTQ